MDFIDFFESCSYNKEYKIDREIEVGLENTFIGSSNIQYTYTPVSLNRTEVDQLTHLVERFATPNNTEEGD